MAHALVGFVHLVEAVLGATPGGAGLVLRQGVGRQAGLGSLTGRGGKVAALAGARVYRAEAVELVGVKHPPGPAHQQGTANRRVVGRPG